MYLTTPTSDCDNGTEPVISVISPTCAFLAATAERSAMKKAFYVILVAK